MDRKHRNQREGETAMDIAEKTPSQPNNTKFPKKNKNKKEIKRLVKNQKRSVDLINKGVGLEDEDEGYSYDEWKEMDDLEKDEEEGKEHNYLNSYNQEE